MSLICVILVNSLVFTNLESSKIFILQFSVVRFSGSCVPIGGLGRHIGRQSTDISVDYRSTIGRLSVDYRSTIGRQSTDYRSTVDRLSVDCRPTIGRWSTDISADSRPINVLTDIVLNHRYSTDT